MEQDTAGGQRLEDAIRSLLATRAGSICPSEAARAVGSATTWRSLMEPARQAAARLVAAGEVEITQGGEVVDPQGVRGPIRIRRRDATPAAAPSPLPQE